VIATHAESAQGNRSAVGAAGLPSFMLERGLVTPDGLRDAQEHSSRAQTDLTDALVSLGLTAEHRAYAVLAAAAGVDLVDLDDIVLSELAVRLVPERLARRHLVVPMRVDNRTLTYATCRPFAAEADNDLRFASGRRTAMVVATRAAIMRTLDQCYATRQQVEATPDPVRSRPVIDRVPAAPPVAATSLVIDRCHEIIARALAAGASDIQFECSPDGGTVRHRVGGTLQPVLKLPAAMAYPIRDQFKTMARIAVAIRNRPQEGTFRLTVGGCETDVRLANEPVPGGERIVMRIVDGQSPLQDLGTVGYDDAMLAGVRSALASRNGLVLVAGPGGSGTTTTLYAALAEIRANRCEVVTIEDPIERTVPGVNQITVSAKTGRTLPVVLRSMLLRQPKAIMVDEVRDDEAAQVAVQAARNGHLVLSSITADDAVTAVTRLNDLVLDPVKVSASLRAVVAQRLVRTLCERCRIVHDDVEARRRGVKHHVQRVGASAGPGCARCKRTGYVAPVMIAELLTVTDDVREAIARRATPQEIRAAFAASGSPTLRSRALALVEQGVTSIQEVERVLGATRQAPVAQRAVRVLVTDDEPVTRTLLKSLLGREGFEVLEATTGQQAIDVAMRERPDLMIIDLNMPEMNGYEAIGRLRTDPEMEALPILVLTADESAGVERRVLELGADDYIVKPFDPGILLSRVNAVFRRLRLKAA
jgi:type IV pilus assembly protein PilB